MDDLISRKAAIKAVNDALRSWSYMVEWRDNEIRKAIKEVPSSQPEADEVARDIATIIENEKDMRVIQKNAEQKWIPCSERMPDTYTTVLVTHRGGVSFAWHNGRYWTRGAMSKRKELKTVKAWMPLPDPWKGEEE